MEHKIMGSTDTDGFIKIKLGPSFHITWDALTPALPPSLDNIGAGWRILPRKNIFKTFFLDANLCKNGMSYYEYPARQISK